MSDEAHDESSAKHLGEGSAQLGEGSAGSGWTTTKQAAKVLGVSRRSVQEYVNRGLLEARVEGEGVSKTFYVSIDSLNAMRTRRRDEVPSPGDFTGPSAHTAEPANPSPSTGEALRHTIDRLEARTVEATELRIRLELTERAQSTLEEQLAEERRRREKAERRAEELERRLETPQAPETPTEQTEDTEPPADVAGREEGVERRSWWRRFFGFE